MFSLLTGNSRRFTAMAIWPFIISRLKRSDLGETVVHHERIHFRQQLEMLFVFFFLWYLFEYFVRWIRLKDKDKAYRSIAFEREAYRHESDPDYLQDRRPFSWIKLIAGAHTRTTEI